MSMDDKYPKDETDLTSGQMDELMEDGETVILMPGPFWPATFVHASNNTADHSEVSSVRLFGQLIREATPT